ncbi:hypothetical protein T11_8906 [Trichinella zimbabwensis]|uniref:Uncharacterized protein n=1 Tax=Trichinella zimbabwensis TaxID=268475 RepID=A0A0V1H4W3_9BILA|nr:hypothetical protein T11_8906 [Trichinella zimbabwensis]
MKPIVGSFTSFICSNECELYTGMKCVVQCTLNYFYHLRSDMLTGKSCLLEKMCSPEPGR